MNRHGNELNSFRRNLLEDQHNVILIIIISVNSSDKQHAIKVFFFDTVENKTIRKKLIARSQFSEDFSPGYQDKFYAIGNAVKLHSHSLVKY